MNVKRILLGFAAILLIMGLAGFVSANEHASSMGMDCESMFKKTEQMLSEDAELSTEDKAKRYGMAARAYEKCKRAMKDMQEAEEFFKKVFDKSGKM